MLAGLWDRRHIYWLLVALWRNCRSIDNLEIRSKSHRNGSFISCDLKSLGKAPQIHLTFGNNPKGKRAIGLYRDNFISAACLQWGKSNPSIWPQWDGSTHGQREERRVLKMAGLKAWADMNHVYLKLTNTHLNFGFPNPTHSSPSIPLQSNQTTKDSTQEPGHQPWCPISFHPTCPLISHH